MKATGIVRSIDELGRIVIPKELRKKMNMTEGTEVEIFVEDNMIALMRYSASCTICGASEGLSEVKGKKICRGCIDELAKLAD